MKERQRTRVAKATTTMIAALALVVAACGGGDSAAPEPAPAPGGASEAPAATGPSDETLRIGMPNLAGSGVPWLSVGSPGQYMWSAVFDALTFVAGDGSVEGALAESWEAVNENEWIFKLRSGIEFQNGEAFNADAVVATFDVLLSEEGRATYPSHTNNYSFVSSVEKVDDLTVRITTSAPSPLLPNAMAIVFIVPPAYFASVGDEGFATAPIGTGPYVATNWGSDRIDLERWDGSYRGVPDYANVSFLLLPEPASRLQALASGQVDVIQALQPDQIDQIEASGFELFIASRYTMMSLVLISNRGGPLEDQRVRQALNYAVDKDTIASELLRGITQAAFWPTPGVNGHDPAREPYPYDPDLARQLLAEAGYASGFNMTAEVTLGAFPGDRDVYEAVAGYLADVGVNLELIEIDFGGTWLPNFTGRDGADWAGDAFGGSWGSLPTFDGARPLPWYHSCGWVNEVFCDEENAAVVRQLNATFDTDERNALLKRALDRSRENPSAIHLVELVELWAHAPTVSGFDVPAQSVDWISLRFNG